VLDEGAESQFSSQEGVSQNAANIDYMTLKAMMVLKKLQEMEVITHPGNRACVPQQPVYGRLQ
jgi:hypothetical protein